MPVLLHIETATRICSVALSENGKCLFREVDWDGPSHAVQLGVFVDHALAFAEKEKKSIAAVSVSAGPGSYTGLRIGVSMAKGLCYGMGVPLIALSGLKIMAHKVRGNTREDALLCPMLDARRMEVYTALYDRNLEERNPVQALIVDENTFSELPENQAICLFGNGSEKCRGLIKRSGIYYVDDVHLLAEDMIELAEEAYTEKCFQDVAYYEPFYLKEFQASIPKKLNQLIGRKE